MRSRAHARAARRWGEVAGGAAARRWCELLGFERGPPPERSMRSAPPRDVGLPLGADSPAQMCSRGFARHVFTLELIGRVLCQANPWRTWSFSFLCPLGPREGGRPCPSLYFPSHRLVAGAPASPPPQRVITTSASGSPRAACMAKPSPWLHRDPQRSPSSPGSGPPPPETSLPTQISHFHDAAHLEKFLKSVPLPLAKSELTRLDLRSCLEVRE